MPKLCSRLIYLFCVLLLPLRLSAQLALTSDALTAPVHTVVHLTATAAPSATGSVTFLDNAQPLISLPLDSRGIAILGIASLSAGTHTLSAVYSGDATNPATTSAPVALTLTPQPSALTVTAGTLTTYAGTPLNLSAALAPSSASGTLTIADASSTLATLPVPGTSTPSYQSFGDSTTAGALSYPALVAASFGLTHTAHALAGSLACDILPAQILPGQLSPSQSASPLSSLMVGTNDAVRFGTPYLPVFSTCQQAALAWLAIPREYKILPGDPALTVSSGTWTSHPNTFDSTTFGTLFNSSGIGSARVTITTTGKPLYLWYLLADQLPGTFTLTLDGVPTGITYGTQPSPAISSLSPQSIGYALLRLPVAAGVHVLDITVQSGTVGILAAATPPSPGITSVHPTVLVTDVPSQNNSAPAVSPSVVTQYSTYIQSSINLLSADGLDIRSVPTRSYLLGDPSEFLDSINPSPLGHAHLAAAFASVLANVPTAPFASFSNAPAAFPVTLTSPGVHTLTPTYSGDSVYSSATAAPLSINVLPQADSSTTLSTPQTRYTAGTAIPFTAVVTPPTATGTVTFYDGTTFLAQQPLLSGSTVLTTSTLSPGLHTLTAVYSGDSPDTSSASPPLTIQVDLNSPTLTLAPLPATVPFGTQQQITAAILPLAATGDILFSDSFLALGQSTSTQLTLGHTALSGGSASLAAGLAVGTHTITAFYPGDSVDLPATSAPLTVQVLPLAASVSLTASPATLPFGSTATLTATVTPASATGTITFRDASGTLDVLPLLNGVATFSLSSLARGTHILSAIYSGDATHASATSGSASVQVTAAVPSIVLSAPATLLAGDPVTLTATLPALTTGPVIFSDSSTGSLGQSSLSNGTATLTLPALPVGSYSLTARYFGDINNAPATSPAIAVQVNLRATTTSLAALPSSLPLGVPLSLTATVSPVTVTGQLTFLDSGSPLGTALIANGTASLSVSNLPSGPHNVCAVYSGDALNAGSTSAHALLTIAPDATSTSLSLAQVSVPAGAPVIFNVRVSSPGTSTPAGTVTIRSGSTVLASAPLTNAVPSAGYATLSVDSATLGLGTFPAVAYFTGSTSDAPSDTSATLLTFTIVPIPTSATLSLSRTLVPLGSPVALTASVSSTTGTPTGSVTFFANGASIATMPLSSVGSATTTFTPTLPGAHSTSATYNPAGFFSSTIAAPQVLTVTLPLALTLTPGTLSLSQASSQSAALTITPLSGFSGAIATSCVPSDTFITCSVDAPSTISATATGTLHVTIAHDTLALAAAHSAQFVSLALLLPLLTIRHRRHLRGVVFLAILAVALSGCAEGGNFGAIPPGTYGVTVQVNAAGATVPATLLVNIPK